MDHKGSKSAALAFRSQPRKRAVSESSEMQRSKGSVKINFDEKVRTYGQAEKSHGD